jgi:hypothetical protein
MTSGCYLRRVHTAMPANSVFSFRSTAFSEGLRGSLSFSVPAAVARGLVHLGWAHKWLCVQPQGLPRLISATHGPRDYPKCSLPKWWATTHLIQAGSELDLEVFDGEYLACDAGPVFLPDGVVDWAALCPENALPVKEHGERFSVHPVVTVPFSLARFSSGDGLWALLGSLQAQRMRTRFRRGLDVLADVVNLEPRTSIYPLLKMTRRLLAEIETRDALAKQSDSVRRSFRIGLDGVDTKQPGQQR